MRYIFQSNSQRTSYYILQALAHKLDTFYYGPSGNLDDILESKIALGEIRLIDNSSKNRQKLTLTKSGRASLPNLVLSTC